MIGGELMIKSLLHYNDISCDIIILVDNTFTQENKDKLAQCYSNIHFHIVDEHESSLCGEQFRGDRKWAINPACRFDIFKFSEYDRIVYIDSDILIVDSIDALFTCEHDFAAAPYSTRLNINSINTSPDMYESHLFNAGVLSIGKKYLNNDMRDRLVDTCLSYRWTGNQAIFNKVFMHKAKLMPIAYNLTTESLTTQNIDKAKVYHFVGHKKVWDNGNIFDRFDENIIFTVGIPLIIKLSGIYNRHCKLLCV
jgi:lipopolysaccharide biosynthesis glycosyltransferase